MKLKPGTTSYMQSMPVERRHQRQLRPGETRGERQIYKTVQAQIEAEKPGFLGKIRDFFLGPKMPDIKKFAPNARYNTGTLVSEHHKNLERGIKNFEVASDADLISLLNRVAPPKR